MSYTESLNIVLILNGVGLIGRITPRHMADKMGAVNVFLPMAAATGICVLCWMAVKSTTGM